MFDRQKDINELEKELLTSTDAEKKQMEAMKLQAAIAEKQFELREFAKQEENFTRPEDRESFRKRCHAIMKCIRGYNDRLDALNAEENDIEVKPRRP